MTRIIRADDADIQMWNDPRIRIIGVLHPHHPCSMLKRLHLRDGETVVAVIRRSFLAYCGGFLLGAFLVLLAFFLLTPLLARGTIGIAAIGTLFIVGTGAIVRSLWFWHGTAFVVTDRRIVDVERRGAFHRTMAEARFDRVEDISVRVRGILSTIFRLGDIRVQTTGASAFLEIRHIRHPERVHDLLGRYQHAVPSRRAPTVPGVDVARLSDGALLTLEEAIAHELAQRDRQHTQPTPDPLQE